MKQLKLCVIMILTLFSFMLGSGILSAQQEIQKGQALTVVTIEGEFYLDRYPDFDIIINNAVRSLGKNEINTTYRTALKKMSTLEKKLDFLNTQNIKKLYLFKVNFPADDEAIVTIEAYKTENRQKTVFLTKTYNVDSISSFISYLQYDIPLTLKLNVNKIGRVISKNGRLLFLDLGDLAGVKIGDIFRVFREGLELTNANGEIFGRVDETAGIVEVKEVTNFYSNAEIMIGGISVQEGDFVEKIEGVARDKYIGKVNNIYKDRVAINLGANVGVTLGSYYAVFQNLKRINDTSSFRANIGSISIEEVHSDYSIGTLALSNFRNISNILVAKDMVIEEIVPPKNHSILLGITPMNILDTSQGRTLMALTYELSSTATMGNVYRFRLGDANGDFMYGAGIKSSLNYSPNFFVGVDAFALNGVRIHLFSSAVIPIVLLEPLQVSMELGYTGGGNNADYNGLGVQVALNIPLF